MNPPAATAQQPPPAQDAAQAAALSTEPELIAAAADLAGDSRTWTPAERRLARNPCGIPNAAIAALRAGIVDGRDPLGEAFRRIRPPGERRLQGAIYTPLDIVDAMTAWAASGNVRPARVVDPGAGSGRFLSAAAARFPEAQLVAVETDPLAALMLRATAHARGFADRLELKLADYRRIHLPKPEGPTLFIGNPPYIRHHRIEDSWKDWYARAAARRGLKASKLAGLHLHFFLKTACLARKGDFGTFITAAEWLDVNYGHVLRRLLADKLGGVSLHVLDPAIAAFPGTATTAAITCFRVGLRPRNFRMRAVETRSALGNLAEGRNVPRSEAAAAPRWSPIVYDFPKPPSDRIELGELFRVHRGQATGANKVWIAGGHAANLPRDYLLPTITRARELFGGGDVLADAAALRRVIDLPADLDELPCSDRRPVAAFLAWAKTQNAHRAYIARNRRSWWAVGLRAPAPVVCTYMARRPPAFVRNQCGARLLNIAHGLYPRDSLPDKTLMALIAWLKTNVRLDSGRIYAGGLAKFEPKEVERIPIPAPDRLDA